MGINSLMIKNHIAIQVQGRTLSVPVYSIDDKKVITTGKWLKIASVMDEEFLEGEAISDPAAFVPQLKGAGVKADIFTFSQKLPSVFPKYRYQFEWENFAVIPITTYSDWWDKRVERDVKKAVNRAKKVGVVVRVAEFDDAFVEGVRLIYNESPIRQGKPFWHYQKDFETIKRENSTYLDRSICIGAYYKDELIGFIRMLRVGTVAMTLQVISKMQDSEKKPTNALIAKAVEVCELNKTSHLIYSRFMYNNIHSSLTEFKRRNGFEQVLVPKYYIPLTKKGSMALKAGIHLSVANWLPAPVFARLRQIRSLWNRGKIHVSKEPL